MTNKEKYEHDVRLLSLKSVTELRVLQEMIEDALVLKKQERSS